MGGQGCGLGGLGGVGGPSEWGDLESRVAERERGRRASGSAGRAGSMFAHLAKVGARVERDGVGVVRVVALHLAVSHDIEGLGLVTH